MVSGSILHCIQFRIKLKILAILKSLKAKIAFLDFRKIEDAFLKTNYITFSYLAYQWKSMKDTAEDNY